MEFTGKIRYSFKNDYMFKAVLQKNPNVLKNLLASLLHLQINEIQSIDIKNPIVLGENIDNKAVILDILLVLNGNRQINIELQVVAQSFWKERSLTYLCKLYNQLNVGEEYSEAMKTIHIGILDFELFPGEEQFYSQNLFMDKITHRIYSDNLALNVLCLKEIENATQEDRDCGLYLWAKLFAATTWEELMMIAENNDVLKDAVVTIKQLSEDQRIRLQCEARRRYEMDWKTMQKKLEAAQANAAKAKRDAVEAKKNETEAKRSAQKAQALALETQRLLDEERENTQKLLRELELLKRTSDSQ